MNRTIKCGKNQLPACDEKTVTKKYSDGTVKEKRKVCGCVDIKKKG